MVDVISARILHKGFIIVVVADEAGENGFCTQIGEAAGDVSGAAWGSVTVVDFGDRNGRVGGELGHFGEVELIEHNVTDD